MYHVMRWNYRLIPLMYTMLILTFTSLYSLSSLLLSRHLLRS